MHQKNSEYKKIWELSKQHKVSYRPDTEKGLSRLREKMAKEKKKEHIRGNTAIRYLIPLAAAALVAGLCLALYMTNQQHTGKVYQTMAGEIRSFELEDGSTVTLNENSRLMVNNGFLTNNKREVTLSGEACFEVAKIDGKPFIIGTQRTTTTVLGTSFYLRAIPTEDSTVLSVIEGKVSFSDDQSDSLLEGNDVGICRHLSQEMVKKEQEQLNVPNWFTDDIVARFNTHPLSQIITILEEEMAMKVENNYDDNCKISFTIYEDDTVNSIVERLKAISNNAVEMNENGTIVFKKLFCDQFGN